MSNVTWQTLNTVDNPGWTPSLNGLPNGSWAISAFIDNTALLLTDAIAQLNLGAETAAGASGTPSIALAILPSADGVNFADPQSGAAPPTNLIEDTATLLLGGSVQIIILRPKKIEPVKFKLLLNNNMGVSFPASGVSFGFYRYGLQG